MKVKIIRLLGDEIQTLGQWFVFDGIDKIFECKTLELAWKDNKQKISCIPCGTYMVKKTFSPSFKKDLYEILNVPGRSGIRIHPANYAAQLKGCIAVGQSFFDINKDGKKDITASQVTYENLDKLLPNKFEIQII